MVLEYHPPTLVLDTALILGYTNQHTNYSRTQLSILGHNQASSGTTIILDDTDSSNTMMLNLLVHGLALVITLVTASPVFKRDFPNPEPISGDISSFVHDPTGEITPYTILLEAQG